MSNWHVASTMPRHEGKVVEELVEMGFQAVCPRFLRKLVIGGGKRHFRGRLREQWVTVPLFPNYIVYSGPVWQRAQAADGLTCILRFAGNRDAAAVLPAELIGALRGPAGDGIVPEPLKVVRTFHEFLVGQRVRIHSGLMSGADGVVVSSTHARVQLLLTAAGKKVTVDATSLALEPA